MIQGHGGNIYALARKLGCSPADIDDLSSNINPLGPPPGLIDHLKARMTTVRRLPEVDGFGATAQMADMLGVPQNRVLAGAGTTQFIYAMFSALSSRRVLIVGPTYADYADACRAHGLEPEYFTSREEDNFLPDMALLNRQVADADTVVICNPNNPTGVLMAREELTRLCRRHPQTRFVIDESYLSFVADAENLGMAACGLDNVTVLHSLSKIYCLPGLRIGFWVAASETVSLMQRHVTPWRLNSLAQAAVAFLHGNQPQVRRFTTETRSYVNRERTQMTDDLASTGRLKLFPSDVSYFLIRLPAPLTAGQVCAHFEKARILVRNCDNFHGLDERFIRIAVNQPQVNQRVAQMLKELVSR